MRLRYRHIRYGVRSEFLNPFGKAIFGVFQVPPLCCVRCEDPRPDVWSMCVSCLCPCISLSHATPLGRSRYQTSELLNSSEFPTELPTHMRTVSGRTRPG